MKTAIFLSIREKAKRLPKKVLREVCGQTLTEHLIDRLKTAMEPDRVILCTSVHPDDTVLCDLALKKGVHVFRGSEDDKLDRYVAAAKAFDIEFFTVVDGDDIFCSAENIDRVIRTYKQTQADYIIGDHLPLGATCFGVKTSAMAKVMTLKKEKDTEVWGGYFTTTGLFACKLLEPENASWKHPEYRMTLDYPEDLEFFTKVFQALYKPGQVFSFDEIMNYLNAHPEVVAINAAAQQAYEAHLKKSAPVSIQAPAVVANRVIPASRKKLLALQIGLGSMGKRRIRCLKALGVEKIMGFDFREDRRAEAAEKYGIEPMTDLATAFDRKPDVVTISTPPDKHLEYAMMAAKRGIHFFTEAGVLNDDFDKLEALARKNKCVAAPSCTMRFFPGPKKIKEVIAGGAIGRPCSFTYQSGQYLPDWHPWESIKDFYVSKPITGACREIVPFELVWLEEILGPFDTVKAVRGRLGDLEAPIDDVYHLLLANSGKKIQGHLTVDVLARPAVRFLRVVGTRGQLIWDAGLKTVSWFTMDGDVWHQWQQEAGTVEKGYINPEEPYIEEIQRVLLAIEGTQPYPYTYSEDSRVLDVLYAAEKNAGGK